MEVSDYMRVAPHLHDCPSCKKQKGTLEVMENLIIRKCPCGFVLTMNVRNGTSKKKIDRQIEYSLNEMQKRRNTI